MKKIDSKEKYFIGILLAIYIGSYFTISRVSESEVNHNWGMEKTFIYVPGFTRELEKSPDGLLFKLHCCLFWFYYPISLLDQRLGGPQPMASLPLFKLEK